MSCSTDSSSVPWLLVLSGRPGTGKTTLAKGLVRATQACYLRVDVVETALLRTRDSVGADGYLVLHGLAAANLQLGVNVIVDAVNAVPEARAGWIETAQNAGARLLMIETVLPDRAEHRARVERRLPDIAGHLVPSWNEVQSSLWVAWDEARDGQRVVIDSTDSQIALEQALALLL